MKVIGLLTTYPAEELGQAKATIQDFTKIRIDQNGAKKLEIKLI